MESKVATIIRYIMLTIWSVLVVYPILWVWLAALRPTREIYTSPFGFPSSINWENIIRAWDIGNFSTYFQNSLLVTLITTVVVLMLSSLTAYALARVEFKGRELIFYGFLLGLMLPPQMIMIPLFILLRNLSLLNSRFGLILVYVALAQPFGIFLLRGFFRSLPREISDAARIDGCSEFDVYWRVILPLSREALGSLAAFQSLWTWNEFIFALVFIQDDRLRTIPLGLMHFQGRYTIDIGGIAGAATIATVPIVLTYLFLQRHFVRGVTAGALVE